VADPSLARERAIERDTKAISPAERERLAILVNNLINAEADVDDARRDEEAACRRLEDAIARRDDLQHRVETILVDSSRSTERA